MVRLKLHNTDEPEWHLVPALATSKGKNQEKSAIMDVQVAEAEIWNDCKFADFLKKTMYDPAVGYLISSGKSHDVEGSDETDPFITGATSFNNPNINPLVHDLFDNLHDDNGSGLSSLSSGGKYYTGAEGPG